MTLGAVAPAPPAPIGSPSMPKPPVQMPTLPIPSFEVMGRRPSVELKSGLNGGIVPIKETRIKDEFPQDMSTPIKREIKEEVEVNENSLSEMLELGNGHGDGQNASVKKAKNGKESDAPTERKSYKPQPFWCDLCQVIVSQCHRAQHFAVEHFSERLRSLLPINGPFQCPMCRHEARHFASLCTHFLARHNLLESWIRRAVAKMEDEAIPKSIDMKRVMEESNKQAVKRELSSEEETDSDEEVSCFLLMLKYFDLPK